MSFPTFLKGRTTDEASPTQSLQPTRGDAIVAANQLGETVANLVAERDHLADELRLARSYNETLTARLDQCEKEREYYLGKATFFERFATSIVTNFNTIRMILDETQTKAREFARTAPEHPTNPPPTVTQPLTQQQPDAEEARLRAVESALSDLQQTNTNLNSSSTGDKNA